MKTVVGILAVVAVALALPAREKRQAQATGCLSAFQNVPNLCANNPNGQVFFKHPSDPTKFLQCDVTNRMYIIQCPAGEAFDIRNSACQPTSSVTQIVPTLTTQPHVPTTAPPPRLIPSTNPPTVPQMVPVLATTTASSNSNGNANNPCTPQNVLMGQIYFPFPGDRSRYYECDLLGNPTVQSCPPTLQWDQNILSCVYPNNNNNNNNNNGGSPVIGIPTTPRPQILANQAGNPCTQQAIAAGRLFFPHPSDSHKYIQCDLWGDAFTNTCPSGLVWNAYLETCYSPNGRK